MDWKLSKLHCICLINVNDNGFKCEKEEREAEGFSSKSIVFLILCIYLPARNQNSKSEKQRQNQKTLQIPVSSRRVCPSPILTKSISTNYCRHCPQSAVSQSCRPIIRYPIHPLPITPIIQIRQPTTRLPRTPNYLH